MQEFFFMLLYGLQTDKNSSLFILFQNAKHSSVYIIYKLFAYGEHA